MPEPFSVRTYIRHQAICLFFIRGPLQRTTLNVMIPYVGDRFLSACEKLSLGRNIRTSSSNVPLFRGTGLSVNPKTG